MLSAIGATVPDLVVVHIIASGGQFEHNSSTET
jgi:hypothetical protein